MIGQGEKRLKLAAIKIEPKFQAVDEFCFPTAYHKLHFNWAKRNDTTRIPTIPKPLWHQFYIILIFFSLARLMIYE